HRSSPLLTSTHRCRIRAAAYQRSQEVVWPRMSSSSERARPACRWRRAYALPASAVSSPSGRSRAEPASITAAPPPNRCARAGAPSAARSSGRGAGVGGGPADPTIDLPAMVERKKAMVARWRDGVRRRIEAAGDRLRFVHDHARFVGPREIELAGQRYRAETII